MGGITRYDKANVYHVLPEVFQRPGIACWHCCELIHDVKTCVPIPRLYDGTEEVFHVFGATCSPGCAKAYIIEHTSFDRGQHLNVFVRMLHDVYGIDSPVVETPPRPALVRFGGVFDPTKVVKTECKLVQPPFVSYCMLAEERANEQVALPTPGTASSSLQPLHSIEEADTFDEPPPPALFAAYAQRRGAMTRHADPVAEAPSKRRRGGDVGGGAQGGVGGAGSTPAPSAPSGPMAKFVRQREE